MAGYEPQSCPSSQRVLVPRGAPLIRKREEIQEDFAALAALERELGGPLKTEGAFRTLQENWRFLAEKMLGLAPADLDDLHAQLLADIQALMARVGDTSNLILDPDLDSYYLMDAVLLKLPEGAQLSGKARILGKKALQQGKALRPAEQEQFVRLGALLRFCR